MSACSKDGQTSILPRFGLGKSVELRQTDVSDSPATSNYVRRTHLSWLLPVVLLLVLILLRPVPLVGDYTDDFQYLAGAHCVTCLPANHWQQRFLIVWPTAAELYLFGSNIWSMMLFPVICSASAVALLFGLTKRQYGEAAAIIAACILALTPIFSERSMRIGVDVPELTLLLGALFIVQRAHPQVWAGALVAVAVLSRPTQLAAVPMIALAGWTVERRQLKWFFLGFLWPLALDAFLYWLVAGDPFYAWKLSLHHVEIFSRQLSPSVDRSKIELLNPDYIGGWVPSAGVRLHWTVQGIVNLLLNGRIALTLWTGILFSAISFRNLDRLQFGLIVSAALYFGALTYFFAVDPQPRMFLPLAAIAAVLAGSLTDALLPWPKTAVPITMFALVICAGITGVLVREDLQQGAKLANAMLDSGSYELTRRAREALSLRHWQPPSRKGHLLDISVACYASLNGRPLVHKNGQVCIYR